MNPIRTWFKRRVVRKVIERRADIPSARFPDLDQRDRIFVLIQDLGNSLRR
jgi:hypothetical protein